MASAHDFEIIPHGSDVPASRRDVLLDTIERVMATNWRFTQRHWSHEDSPFHDDYGLVFASQDAEIVAYSIYRRVMTEGTPALYRAGAAVAASHQRHGVYGRMSQAMLSAEWDDRPGVEQMYLSWRTRSPLIWAANARLCTAVAPSIADGKTDAALEEACLRLARRLYPDCPIEPPSMVMRGVYAHLHYIREPYDLSASHCSEWYAATVPDPADAVFSTGIVQKRT